MVGIEVVNYTFFIYGTFDFNVVIQFGYGGLLGLAITHVFRFIIKKLSVFEWRPRALWTMACVATLTMSTLLNALFFLPTLIQNASSQNVTVDFIDLFAGTINWARYIGVWVILYFMYHILERARKIEEEKLKSENAARSAELDLLKSQLNPHFLFNALNSIKALVSIDQAKSKDAIVKLSELLRFTLNYKNELLIPLFDEIEEVRKYLSLEQIRFGDRLQIHYSLDIASLDKRVPPAVVLTLAENAIKHGVTKHIGSCTLQVKSAFIDSTLVIEMTNPGTLSMLNHTGIGVQNVKRRLYYLYGTNASFQLAENNGTVVSKIQIIYNDNKNDFSRR